MTGLDLESFLRLLRADLGAWVSLGAVLLVLALMAWTNWGSRRALRKCLVVSILVHIFAVSYGSSRLPLLRPGPLRQEREDAKPRIKQIRVEPLVGGSRPADRRGGTGWPGRRLADWDRPNEAIALADPALRPDPPGFETPELVRRVESAAPTAPEAAPPELSPPEPPNPEARAVAKAEDAPTPSPARIAPTDPSEVPAPVVERAPQAEPDQPTLDTPESPRLRPELEGVENIAADLPEIPPIAASSAGRAAARPRPSNAASAPALAMPEVEVRPQSPSQRSATGSTELEIPKRLLDPAAPPALARATPLGIARLPEVTGGRPLPDVPEVYRSRLDPNRSARAIRAGASAESEKAVERALDWLARHQDPDGHWDAGTRKLEGLPVRGDHSFTIHCPPGEICSGECFYDEADTAMTGLALLAYLGAGYTHTGDSKHAPTIEKGIQYLLLVQKPDGDLRGRSVAVGMYCHAMAGLALCEAYALTGDERLRAPVERAVQFVLKARARDGMSWRYEPREPFGDTSILGWVILLLKSAKVVGIPVPDEARAGAIRWLDAVAEGRSRGLARYVPGRLVTSGMATDARYATPTMTAEAWVCRQFLGVGGPGPASTEAANYLLAHSPARAPYNLYYWYYGTLALYQHGGDAWKRWNAEVRDQLVRHQQTTGHRAGSWDPEDSKSQYDHRGGRIYCTALATLTLEVYYRYLRLYDEPGPT
ncbi:MAG: hypothetical protein IRY99_16595, partial [Isosphaeraceae bacterium]|nr:hypothetical protein [Isosphaeraceae bacterium]